MQMKKQSSPIVPVPDDVVVPNEKMQEEIILLFGPPSKATSRGRPRLDKPKVKVNLRVDQDIIIKLRAAGPGWQTRTNKLLRHILGLDA